jgi:hypothetical protein
MKPEPYWTAEHDGWTRAWALTDRHMIRSQWLAIGSESR